MPRDSAVWHPEALGDMLWETLITMERASLLLPFYLGGGTGLALQLGHRRSHDLDFFTADFFEPDSLLPQLKQLGSVSVVAKSAETLHVEFRGAKVSFLRYAYPELLPALLFRGVRVADGREIACMKISAIAGRGAKRDFVDLYSASLRYGLPQLVQLFRKKYAETRYSELHVSKALMYFDDAEKDPPPDLLTPTSWEEVKQFFLGEAPKLF